MILGVGVDVVDIDRISRSLSRFGEKFVTKILSEAELSRYRSRHPDPAWLAKRFAAKEAAAKALGTGMRQGVHFRQITIARARGGAPHVMLEGSAEQHASRLGVQQIHLSISDETHYAVAFAVFEG